MTKEYQLINVSIITVNKEKGYNIIIDRQTIYHAALKSNIGTRILKAITEATLKSIRR